MRLRAVFFAASAVLGAFTLTACQNDPSVAAYIAGTTITEAQVDQLLNASPHVAPVPQQQQDGSTGTPPALPPLTRSQVVTTLVLDKLCKGAQAAGNFADGSITPEQAGANAQVAPSSPYAIQDAKTLSCLSGYLGSVRPVKPSEAQAREIYDRAKAGSPDGIAAYNDIKDQILADQDFAQALGAKESLEKLAGADDVTINPRYRPLQYPVSSFTASSGARVALVVATLGQDMDAVHAAT
jgi:hypothetical protein